MSDTQADTKEEVPLTKEADCESDDNSLKEQQEARYFLRERFLRAVTMLVGHKATFQMAGDTSVQAEFGGIDLNFQEVFVKDLHTPLGVQPNALLRASDIVSIGFKM